MNIKPIKTRRDYNQALRRVEALWDAASGTAAADELDILATLISAYEDKHFPISSPNPVAAILFRLEQLELTRQDLETYIGSSGRVSEVLSGKRSLSLAMIRKLHAGLRIPLENLVAADRASNSK
jgi:HTH-type transcriptional regulator/antitoxin HigA